MSVIGHCCADHADEAEREYKARETLRKQEDYLLASISLIPEKIRALNSLKGAADEAVNLFRKFRKRVPAIHQHLRDLRDRGNARLVLSEMLRSNEEGGRVDYVGPSGFGGRGSSKVETRDVDFGPLAGTTATMRDYNPTKELSDAIRAAELFAGVDGDEGVLNFVAAMSHQERQAALANCQLVDKYHERFHARIADFNDFWSEDNFARLKAYGSSSLNQMPFSAERRIANGRPLITLRQPGEELRVVLGAKMADYERPWKAFTYKKS